MTNKRLQMVLMAALGAAVGLFLIVSTFGLSVLSGKSNRMVDLKLQSKVLDEQLANLSLAKKQIQTYSYIKNVVKEVIPSDKDQAQAVLEIYQLAKEAGISIQSLTFPTSSLGVAGAKSTSTSTSSLISQAKPVSGIKGLYSIPVTIVPETGPQVPSARQVTYAKMLDFLNRIERNQRTAQITQVAIQPVAVAGGKVGSINFSLTVNIFIKP